MGGLVLLFAAGCVLLVTSFTNPRLAVACTLLGYAFIPFAAGMIRIGPLLIHASTAAVLFIAAIRLLVAPRDPNPPQRPWLAGVPSGAMTLLVLFFAGAGLTELAVSDAPGQAASFFLNQLAAPFLVFLLCCDLSARHPTFRRQVTLGVVAAAVTQSVLALLINSGVLTQPFQDAMSTRFWWESMSLAGRQMGATDHPLNLALLIAAAVPLLAYINHGLVRAAAFLLLAAGAALTQSRIGMMAVAVGALYLLLRGAGSRRGRLSTIGAVLIGYVVLDWYGLFDKLLARLGSDDGSSAVRSDAWHLLTPQWERFILHGDGIASIKDTMGVLFGLHNSPESAFLGFVMAYGIPLAVMFFAALIWIALAQHSLNPAVVSLVVVLGAIQFFSSISVLVSSASVILWVAVFLAATSRSFDERDAGVGGRDRASSGRQRVS